MCMLFALLIFTLPNDLLLSHLTASTNIFLLLPNSTISSFISFNDYFYLFSLHTIHPYSSLTSLHSSQSSYLHLAPYPLLLHFPLEKRRIPSDINQYSIKRCNKTMCKAGQGKPVARKGSQKEQRVSDTLSPTVRSPTNTPC